MGTQLQAADLSLDDIETRPDVLEQIHGDYFEAGADAVETKYVRLQSG